MFHPRNPVLVAEIDRKLRTKLAASVAYLADKSSRDAAPDAAHLATVLRDIEGHRQRPATFARYFELVFALKEGRTEAVRQHWRDLETSARQPASLEVKPFTVDAMGSDAARYARLLGASGPMGRLAAPDPAKWDGFDTRVADAFALLDAASPELNAEVRALVCEVVGAVPDEGARAFGGMSSLTLWGAVVLNLGRHRDPLDLIAGLVHESAHLLLFGYAADEPLVSNPLAERFASPLRSDARPMDGVFHATFVCARLHLLYRSLLAFGGTTDVGLDVDALEDRAAAMAEKYRDGAQIVSAHARLTTVGSEVFRATSAYMAGYVSGYVAGYVADA